MKKLNAIEFRHIPDHVGTMIGFGYDDCSEWTSFNKEIDSKTLEFINTALKLLVKNLNKKQ